jgi:hypothetical protein
MDLDRRSVETRHARGDQAALQREMAGLLNPKSAGHLTRLGYSGPMKAKHVLFFIAAVIVCSIGCEDPAKHSPTSRQIESTEKTFPIHRFENVTNAGLPGVALDTVTGQLCKTWDWSYKDQKMSGGLDTLPMCLSLFKGTPSSTDSDDPFAKFGGKQN